MGVSLHKQIIIVLSALFVVVAATYVACAEAYPSATFRYKLTLNVNTPEGLKSASSVREVRMFTQPELLGARPVLAELRGEAVALPLGKGRVLFALLRSEESVDDGYRIVFDAFPISDPLSREGMKYYKDLRGGPVELSPQHYPLLVSFEDSLDPRSIRVAYEVETYQETENSQLSRKTRVNQDNFGWLFGKGTQLKNITIEMTDEPVTVGAVDKHLSSKFWEEFRKWMKSMNISERGKYVPLFDFKREYKK